MTTHTIPADHLDAARGGVLPERIISKIDVGDCWLWTGYCLPSGYGRVRWDGGLAVVHRLLRHLLVGDVQIVSRGLQDRLDHLCRIRNCCNPDHTEPVTHMENLNRGAKPKRLQGGQCCSEMEGTES